MNADKSKASSPALTTIVSAYVIVIAAIVAAWIIYTKSDPQPHLVDVDSFSIFAPMYIVAQAIERFLEPLSSRLNTTTAEKLAVRDAKAAKAAVDALPAAQRTTDALKD